jgi:hypothetical protein
VRAVMGDGGWQPCSGVVALTASDCLGLFGRGEVDPLSLHLPSVESVRLAQLWDSRTLLAFHVRRRPPPRSGLFPAVVGPR